MALLYLDGFETYEDKNDLMGQWDSMDTGSGSYSLITGRFGGQGLRIYSNLYLHKYVTPVTDELYIGLAYKTDAHPNPNPGAIIGVHRQANVYGGTRLSINTGGKLACYPESSSTAYGTGTTVLSTGTWYYIELRIKSGDSDGIMEVRLNGVEELNLTSIDTRRGGTRWEVVNIQGSAPGYNYYDDLYICDTSGSYNNGFLGQQLVELVRPTDAGNYSQWTASAGSNYTCIDEETPNGDTDYVGTTATGNKDTYEHGGMSETGDVTGVKVVVKAKVSSGDFSKCKPMIRSSTTDEVADDIEFSDAYETKAAVFQEDPDTSAAWTNAGVDAAEIGIAS